MQSHFVQVEFVQPSQPIPFVVAHAIQSDVEHLSVKQPPLLQLVHRAPYSEQSLHMP